MEHDSLPIDLLDTPPSLAAARIAIFALRSLIPTDTALAPDQVILAPDSDILTTDDAAAIIAAAPSPVRFKAPQVHDGVLVLQYEQISGAHDRDFQELQHAMSRRALFEQRDVSEHTLASVKVLLDGRAERLLVTGEAFDRWKATYDGPHAYGGGPAPRPWLHAIGLGKGDRGIHPDYEFRFGPPPSTKITRLSVEELPAEAPKPAGARCARCGNPATKMLRRVSGDEDTTEPLCAKCSTRAIPRRPRPRWPSNAAKLTPEILLQTLPYLKSEEGAPIRESIAEWISWADSKFPVGASMPPDVAAIRAMINVYREPLGLD